MESSTSHQDPAVYSRGNNLPKKHGKLHQIKFSGASSGPSIVGGGTGPIRWSSDSELHSPGIS